MRTTIFATFHDAEVASGAMILVAGDERQDEANDHRIFDARLQQQRGAVLE